MIHGPPSPAIHIYPASHYSATEGAGLACRDSRVSQKSQQQQPGLRRAGWEGCWNHESTTTLHSIWQDRVHRCTFTFVTYSVHVWWIRQSLQDFVNKKFRLFATKITFSLLNVQQILRHFIVLLWKYTHNSTFYFFNTGSFGKCAQGKTFKNWEICACMYICLHFVQKEHNGEKKNWTKFCDICLTLQLIQQSQIC